MHSGDSRHGHLRAAEQARRERDPNLRLAAYIAAARKDCASPKSAVAVRARSRSWRLAAAGTSHSTLRTIPPHLAHRTAKPAARRPFIAGNYRAPAEHLLIGEGLYDPMGPDAGREWVEVYNPLPVARALTGYKLGDAEERGKWGEAMLSFPAGAQLGPGATLIVALDANAFFADYGIYPEYE